MPLVLTGNTSIQGRNNMFINCRWETPSPKVEWFAAAPNETQQNYIVGGWGSRDITFSTVLTGDGSTRANGRTHCDDWFMENTTVRFGAAPIPIASGSINLGLAANRWATIYATNGTINTSDGREKDWRGRLNDDEIEVAKKLSKLIGIYRWKKSIDEKGDGARLHAGVIAQDVIDAFTIGGLNPFAYGVVCFDEWAADPANGIEAGDLFGIRYDQLWAFVAAGFEARLAALEG